MENILIIGSGGQLGSELEDYLVSLYGREKIYSSDIKKNNSNGENFILLDALNKKLSTIIKHQAILEAMRKEEKEKSKL